MGSIEELFYKGKSLLKNLTQPALEAKLLLVKSASISEKEFYSEPDKSLTRAQERFFYRLVSKRLSGFPLVYLTGEKEFWSIPFKVFPGVLIPRPETELIVEKVIEFYSQRKETILDIGTGCGNIAISLAKELPNACIFASDISRKALKTARLNASLQGVTRIIFVRGRLFLPFRRYNLKGKCEFVVSNPPYVSKKEWESLSSEIKDHEPRKALVSGKTGLEVIKALIEEAPRYLKAGGYLIFEIGAGQKENVLAMLGRGWENVRCFNDLRGIPRVVAAQKWQEE